VIRWVPACAGICATLRGSALGWGPNLKIGFDWVRFRRDGMGDFFHNAFQNRGLGLFWFLGNWVRFVKSHSASKRNLASGASRARLEYLGELWEDYGHVGR